MCLEKNTMVKKMQVFLRFFKKDFRLNSGKEEVTYYEFYIMLNKVVKMYMPCYRNLTTALKKS